MGFQRCNKFDFSHILEITCGVSLAMYVFDPTLTVMGIKRPVLLIIDGTRVHLSLWISEFCDNKNIILYVLYPNSTHLTQPLDLSLMGSVKVHHKEAVCKWIAEYPFEVYDKFAFPATFTMMWK